MMSTTPARVLVSYSTAAGSTVGIAERIAQVLRAAGCTVRCLPASAVPDVEGVDALVVGSAVHDVAWLAPSVDVLRRAAVSGTTPAVWCFSVGGVRPRGRLTRALAALEVRRIGQQFPVGLRVRDHRLFGGIVEMKGVPLWGRLFFRMIGGKAGDRRDWTAAEAWAIGIAESLTESGHLPSTGTR
jgi:menaquinone-dependent protoporphyrinogen oxidase